MEEEPAAACNLDLYALRDLHATVAVAHAAAGCCNCVVLFCFYFVFVSLSCHSTHFSVVSECYSECFV